MARVSDFYSYIDSFAPFSSQEEWDNSGFLVGEADREVTAVTVCLDVTEEVIRQAADNGCELIVSHHPVIFNAQKSITDRNPAYLCARLGISVISAHTCYDFAFGGVSDILAEAAGLKNIRKSVSGEFTLGETDCETAEELAKKVKSALGCEIQLCLKGKNVNTVGVCGGAGSDFVSEAKAQGADAFLTGEAKHHEFLDAVQNGISLICAGHFETEIISVMPLAKRLQEHFGTVRVFTAREKSPIEHI